MERFPADFMFEINKTEWESLRCNFSTSNTRGGTRYLPFAFTEQGVAMLSSALNSDKAIDVNIAIMRAFVLVRQFVLTNKELAEKLKKGERYFASVSSRGKFFFAFIFYFIAATSKKKIVKFLFIQKLSGQCHFKRIQY